MMYISLIEVLVYELTVLENDGTVMISIHSMHVYTYYDIRSTGKDCT